MLLMWSRFDLETLATLGGSGDCCCAPLAVVVLVEAAGSADTGAADVAKIEPVSLFR